MAEKITKKELKQPDKFQIFLASLLNFFLQHRKKLIYGALSLLLIIIIIAGWLYYQYDQEMKALSVFNKVTEDYHLAMQEKKDLKPVAAAYRDLFNRYPHTRAASYALYRLGNIYVREGNFDEAIWCFKKYVEKNKSDNELLVVAYNALGISYEEKGDLKSALQAYEQASKLKSGVMFESINYGNLARVYEALKDYKKAAEYYEKAKAKAVDPVLKDWYSRKTEIK